MAWAYAIASVGQCICAQLHSALTDWKMPTGDGSDSTDHDPDLSAAGVSLVNADTLARNPPQGMELTVYLYRVAISTSSRNLRPRVTGAVPPKTKRPSLPLELHYLLTAWATDPVVQQRLLGVAIRAMEDQPTLPAVLLNRVGGYGTRGTPPFRDDESVEVTAAPLSQAELVSIWEINKAYMQPSMPYIARVLYLDSEADMPSEKPVKERVINVIKVSS